MFLYYIFFAKTCFSLYKIIHDFHHLTFLNLYLEISSMKYFKGNISVENESYNCHTRVRQEIVDNTGIPGCICHVQCVYDKAGISSFSLSISSSFPHSLSISSQTGSMVPVGCGWFCPKNPDPPPLPPNLTTCTPKTSI